MPQPVSWNRQLGLLVTLLVLGGAAYWAQVKQKPKEEEREVEAKKVFHLKDHQVESITLQNLTQTVTLQCLDLTAKLCKPGDSTGKWEIETPLKTRADSTTVSSLVSTLNNLSFNDTIDLKDETPEKRAALIKEYGLDPATRNQQRMMSVKTPETTAIFYLGKTHPVGDAFFAVKADAPGKVDENQVYLFPAYIKSNIDNDVSHWRDKKILTLDPHTVTRFQVEDPKGKVIADKKTGSWLIHTAQGDLPGDNEIIDSFLTGFSYLQAKGFPPKDLLKGTHRALRITLNGAQPVTVDFLEKGSKKAPPPPKRGTPAKSPPGAYQVFATVSTTPDTYFELDPSSVGRFDKTSKDLRLSKLMSSVERFAAKKVKFASKGLGGEVTLTAADGKWTLETPDHVKKEVPLDIVSGALDRLSTTKVQDFVEDSKVPGGVSGASKDGLTFTLIDDPAKDTVKKKLLFWKTKDGFFAKDLLSSRKESWKLDPALANGLPWDLKFFEKGDSAKQNTPAKL